MEVLSEGGDVTVQLVPALGANLSITATQGITVMEGLSVSTAPTFQDSRYVLKGEKVAEASPNEASSARSLPYVAQVNVDAGSASVTLSQQSWMSAVRARMTAARTAAVVR